MDKLPKATHEGNLIIGENELSCAVLNDGTRILSQSAVYKALDRSARSKSKSGNRADQMPSFLDANNIQPFVNKELKSMIKEVEYIGLNDKVQFGYNARIIPKVAKVYLDARRAKVLTKKQLPVAEACEILTLALADIGITSLVDRATGFIEYKDNGLDKIVRFLENSIQELPAKYVKTFPDEFFMMIHSMKGWSWSKTHQSPAVMGHYINDFVYSRIAPNFLKELRNVNPKVDGKRSGKLHQYTTRDLGHPVLKDHLSGLIVLGRVCNNDWEVFKQMVNTAYPVYGQTLELGFAIDYDNRLNKPDSEFDNNIDKALGWNPNKDK